ncbi:MAG: peptidylprolyl isomerase [Labilithrix sp.]
MGRLARWPGVVLVMLASCKREAPPSPSPMPLASALVGLEAPGVLEARIETTEGAVRCILDEAGTPRSVGMFVGLARGRAAFRDPATNAIVTRPYYDGLPVFRGIEDLMFQSGCPVGDGTGTPGYRIELEPHPDDAARLATPGALLLASYHPPPNREDPSPPPPGQVIGSQFVVAIGGLGHLAGKVTVIGACQDLATVATIARVAAKRERPVTVTRIMIERRP